ncbi:uncharacterized protein LOC131041631 isoform X2 [Cryptomeria japonica]|nr:uncharacterized protein LOC131041631 isoform X2 [Cryptomeria japonica]
MVSFTLDLTVSKTLLTSGVLLKFELFYASIRETSLTAESPSNFSPASVHEIRVPPKALLGLHSYCPIHFDALHMVLVDLSIHAVLYTAIPKLSASNESLPENSQKGVRTTSDLAMSSTESGVGAEDIALWKLLCASHNILINEIENIGRGINRNIDDLIKMEQVTLKSILEKEKLASGESVNIFTPLDKQDIELSEVVEGNNWSVISKADMLKAFRALETQLSSIWSSFLAFHREHRIEILEYLRHVWVEDRSTEWSMWLVHRMELKQNDASNGDSSDDSRYLQFSKESFARASNEDPALVAAASAELHRRSIEQMKINNRFLQDMQIFGSLSQVPVLYIERHLIQSQSSCLVEDAVSSTLNGASDKVGDVIIPKERVASLPSKMANPSLARRALRVVVFVHGFQGHHLDLRLVRNQWLLIDPGAEIIMSKANEDRTTDDFRELGQRLAQEVSHFLERKFATALRKDTYGSFRLSFVGHSIGNIIIRVALTDAAMKPYLNNLYTFLSISGPHLGYFYSSNTLFSSGLWLFKTLKGSPCMHQLTFTDQTDIHNCFLFRLSQEKTFEHFQNVILLSSPQDRYVPYHSARATICQAAIQDSKKGPAYKTMLKNCLDQILMPTTSERHFIRCDVNFDTTSQAGSLNNFIGRTAHIEFLETCLYAKFLMCSFPKMFS